MNTRLTRSFAALAVVATAGLGFVTSPAAQAQDTIETNEICVSSGFFNNSLIRPGNFYTDVSPIELPAGPLRITSATASDAYPSRVDVQQTSERYEVEFVNAVGDVLATSVPTEDLPDFLAEASWTGPLGTVELPAGVVGIRAHLRPDINDDGEPNSVRAVGVTLCWDQAAPLPPVVDQPVTTEPVPPSGPTVTRDGETSAIDVTTTIAPVVEGSTTVAQNPKGPTILPVTGTTTSTTVFAAMSLVAAGGALLLASRSRLS